MSANTLLEVANADFDSIKSSLKDYLRSQSQFEDYDFEGSNLSVLIDLLAYNTYYNAFYTNMVSTEMFLETAQFRNSVVSRAKQIGFTPTSVRGAVAKIAMSVTSDDDIVNITVPKFTKFSSVIDSVTYNFVTTSATTLSPSSGNAEVYTANSITLVQGSPFTHEFIATGNAPESFTIPNANVDTSTISVTVFESQSSSESEVYVEAESVIEADSSSKIYYLEESEDQKFKLVFGDGILGQSLDLGNRVVIDYVISQGNDAFKANTFSLEDSIGYANVSITTESSASGGSDIMDIETIKFLAPKIFQSQNRLVTARDYAAEITRSFPSFASVKAWGGEENDPQIFGKVFVSIKPAEGTTLTNALKTSIIETVLQPKSIVSISPEIIDPEFIYIIPRIEAVFNQNATTKSRPDVSALILSTIQNFSNNTLERFDAFFRYSQVLRLIDDTDVSITNSNMEISLKRLIVPQLDTAQQIEVPFFNAIYHPFSTYDGAVTSTQFTFNGFSDCFFDDNNGTLRIVRRPVTEKVVVKENSGSVDYDNGKIVITDFNISAFVGDSLEITVEPRGNDVVSQRNYILQILDNDIDITLLAEGQVQIGAVAGTI